MNIAVITGASSGLGVEYAKTIIDNYSNGLDEIWLIARRKDRLEKFASEYPQIKIRPVPLDLSIDHSYEELDELLKKENANVEILVNNAGYERSGMFAEMKNEDILSMINVNVKGFTMINRIFLPYMKKGSIGIMVCSISSFIPVAKQAVYSASKAYVRYIGRAIRQEVYKDGINILTMCPGNMDTEMNPKGGTSQSDKVDQLPFLDMKVITKKSIELAKKGDAIYTPGGLYKFYRFASKVLPSAWTVKIIGRMYD